MSLYNKSVRQKHLHIYIYITYVLFNVCSKSIESKSTSNCTIYVRIISPLFSDTLEQRMFPLPILT